MSNPVIPIGIRVGYDSGTSCAVVASSLTSGNMTLVCEGVTYGPFAPSAVGADRGTPDQSGGVTACYNYAFSVTTSGFSPLTRHTFTVSQVGNSGSVSGSFMTKPSATSDFSFFFGGCDATYSTGGDSTGDGNNHGGWNIIQQYVQNGALPTAGIIFVDDHGYVDGNYVNDENYAVGYYSAAGGWGYDIDATWASYSNVNGSGRRHSSSYQTAAATHKQYDYALGYMSMLGMFGSDHNRKFALSNPALGSQTTSIATIIGRDPSRVYCCQNLNYWPQFGDHEFGDDIGWDNVTSTNANWVPGKAVWDAFMGPLQPPKFNAANGNAWGMTLGCVTLIAPDGITNANGMWGTNRSTITPTTVQPYTPVAGELPNIVYGASQINDILTYVDTQAKPFTVFGMMNSIHYPYPPSNIPLGGYSSVFECGAQHPIADLIPSEYNQWYRNNSTIQASPLSIMANPKTNGIAGVTLNLHGDYHRSMVVKNHAPAAGNLLAELTYSVGLGTINGSSNFRVPATVAQGSDLTGYTLIKYLSQGWDNTTHKYHVMRVDVYGSKAVRELHVILMDETGAEMWHGRWLERSSNEVVPVTYSAPIKSSGKSLK